LDKNFEEAAFLSAFANLASSMLVFLCAAKLNTQLLDQISSLQQLTCSMEFTLPDLFVVLRKLDLKLVVQDKHLSDQDYFNHLTTLHEKLYPNIKKFPNRYCTHLEAPFSIPPSDAKTLLNNKAETNFYLSLLKLKEEVERNMTKKTFEAKEINGCAYVIYLKNIVNEYNKSELLPRVSNLLAAIQNEQCQIIFEEVIEIFKQNKFELNGNDEYLRKQLKEAQDKFTNFFLKRIKDQSIPETIYSSREESLINYFQEVLNNALQKNKLIKEKAREFKKGMYEGVSSVIGVIVTVATILTSVFVHR